MHTKKSWQFSICSLPASHTRKKRSGWASNYFRKMACKTSGAAMKKLCPLFAPLGLFRLKWYLQMNSNANEPRNMHYYRKRAIRAPFTDCFQASLPRTAYSGPGQKGLLFPTYLRVLRNSREENNLGYKSGLYVGIWYRIFRDSNASRTWLSCLPRCLSLHPDCTIMNHAGLKSESVLMFSVFACRSFAVNCTPGPFSRFENVKERERLTGSRDIFVTSDPLT